MKPETVEPWLEANQAHLVAAIDKVRGRLHSRSGDSDIQVTPTDAEAAEVSYSIENLCAKFELSEFERGVLLLCAGIELTSDFAGLCASAHGDPSRDYPTFGLALAALINPHWSAIAPSAPLRRFQLIRIEPGNALMSSRLRIDECVLHYLCGLAFHDPLLSGLLESVKLPNSLVPSQEDVALKIARAWGIESNTGELPILQVCGERYVDRKNTAARACRELGISLCSVTSNLIPVVPAELVNFARLCERHAALTDSAIMIEIADEDSEDASHAMALHRLIRDCHAALIVHSRQPMGDPGHSVLAFDAPSPRPTELHALWQEALSTYAISLNGQVERLVSQFDLGAEAIHSLSEQVLSDRNNNANELGKTLWSKCRLHARPNMRDLVQRIEPMAGWDQLVLPDMQHRTLREIASHLRQRFKVYETWGYASKESRGLGVTALFAGASGTGKTMAAEVLASELKLDLYRIDLSQVVSKYIGETEKNLRRLFASAEEGGAILLFDEADALFGKRSEVKDSHDRYANIEVSYLLQRMEAYRGLAILTTNNKSALDSAFLRRIRFVVQFPFPDTTQRSDIWSRIFPANAPVDSLDYAKLSKLNVSGGNIRNIALNAAFLAADSDEPICMKHLLRAARGEYGKLDKQLTDSEIGGWE